MSRAGFPKRPICPTNTELQSLATFFFPQCHSLKVVVCDFGINESGFNGVHGSRIWGALSAGIGGVVTLEHDAVQLSFLLSLRE